MSDKISGNLVDVRNRRIFPAELEIDNGVIKSVSPCTDKNLIQPGYIMPGFIDAHIHIESSMLIPAEFAQWAIPHGTVATVSDPHEIANILGEKGVDFMIKNGKTVPLKFFFGAPSCVPATPFETAGAALPASSIRQMLQRTEIKYLAEMMNWPGVLSKDSEVIEKIKAAQDYGKVIDGHAPKLRGQPAIDYFAAGISTDHECTEYEEAIEKIKTGAKIAIREGSAAKNFEALHPLFLTYPQALMFCSDDKHPDELMEGHINRLVVRALQQGYALFDVLHAACIHPIEHYGLEVGSLQTGDPADFIRVNNLRDFTVEEVFIDGEKTYDYPNIQFKRTPTAYPRQMDAKPIKSDGIKIRDAGSHMRVIEAHDGELITSSCVEMCSVNANGEVVSEPKKDILKIVVHNRYLDQPPAIAFIKGFGLKHGALASSVAHDCHNIIAVGTSDDDIVRSINSVISAQGGISFAGEQETFTLPLPVAGIMTDQNGKKVAERYKFLDQKVKKAGSTLSAPFMTLSFMALLVIPSLKLSDKGLFDGEKFEFVDLFFTPNE